MQIKTTMRYYLTPVRMAIINKTINRFWRKRTLILYWWECIQFSTMEKCGSSSKN